MRDQQLRVADATITVDAETLKNTVVALIAAASAYEKYARRHKVRGPADPFFVTRLADMQKAAETARTMLRP